MTTLPRSIPLLFAGLLAGTLGLPAFAQVIYKCPHNDYTDSNHLSPKEAKEKGCTTLENAPISVIAGPRPKTAASGVARAGSGGDARVDPADQRARDSDARRILEGELKREEDRLAQMKTEYNNGTPDKQGNEIRNYQKYLDRVADMQTAITRKEGDIAALKREIAKYPAPQ